MGIEVFNLSRVSAIEDAANSESSPKGYALMSARVDSDHSSRIDALQEQGFLVREVSLHPVLLRSHAKKLTENSIDVVVQEATGLDLEPLSKIAASSFQISRFHREPQVSNSSANNRFANWVATSLSNPSHTVLNAMNDSGEILGFFIISFENRIATWLLTVMSSDYKESGVTKKLWSKMIEECWERGATRIETTISTDNLKVVGLYPTLGFRFEKTSWVLHKFVNRNDV